MPSPKRQRVRRKQARGKVKKRQSFLRLTKQDRDVIAKSRAGRVERFQHYYLRPMLGYEKRRTLDRVNRVHKLDFLKEVKKLRERFEGEIEVLDEGAGIGTFSTELEKIAQANGLKVNCVRTDLVTFKEIEKMLDEMARKEIEFYKSQRTLGEEKVQQLIREINTNTAEEKRKSLIAKRNIDASPEELAEKFGANRFHMVVSTYGGLNYSNVDVRKGLSNVLTILKPGGFASITFSRAGRQSNEQLIKRIRQWESAHPNATVHIPSFSPTSVCKIRIFKR